MDIRNIVHEAVQKTLLEDVTNFNNIITSILLDFNINNFLTNLSFLYLFPCTRPFWERFFIQITHTSKIIHALFYKV